MNEDGNSFQPLGTKVKKYPINIQKMVIWRYKPMSFWKGGGTYDEAEAVLEDDVAQLAVAAEEVLHVALRRARRQTANVHAVGHRERSVKSSCLKVARFRNENTAKYEEKHASKFE